MIPQFVGIDIGKNEFVVAIAGVNGVKAFVNTAQGHEACVSWLKDMRLEPGTAHIGLEATGGYEFALWHHLHHAGHSVRQLPPAQVNAFARSLGGRAKTDAIDASMIARFVQFKAFRHIARSRQYIETPTTLRCFARFKFKSCLNLNSKRFRPTAGRILPQENIRKLNGLTSKRCQIINVRKALLCQMKQTKDADILALGQDHMALLNRQIKIVEKRIATLLETHADLQEKATLLRSIPGIGPVACSTILAQMPELGRLGDKTLAALAGVAPINHDSGKSSGKRFIKGGRKPLRDVLYQAAMAASRFNPQLKAFADRLKANGKPHKLIIIAVARKLLILANAILKRKTQWVNLDA